MQGCRGSQEGNPKSGGASTPKQSTLWTPTKAERSRQTHLKHGFQHRKSAILQSKLKKQNKTKTKQTRDLCWGCPQCLNFCDGVGDEAFSLV